MKKFITIVVEAPNDEFFKKITLGGMFYGGKITAMGMGDEMTKLEKLEDWIIQNHGNDERVMKIVDGR